jgi:glycosyltransferase involved in cell wall biosynthesis
VEAATAGDVVAGLDIQPPKRVAVGRGSAFVIGGYCYHRHCRTRGLAVEVNGRRQQVDHWGLPREDVFEGTRNGQGPGGQAFRSGFIAMPSLGPLAREMDADVTLVLSLADRSEARTRVATLRLEPGLPQPAGVPSDLLPGRPGPSVAICMATFNPPSELLRKQLNSIREQTHSNWVCLISDDASETGAVELLRREIAGDERFVLARADRRLGFYGNFERALSMVPDSADYVTLCDQDDRWHPRKLERLLGELSGGAQLAYSDARVVDPDGVLLHPSYWTVRRNNHTNFGSLLLANSVTGAASVFRRDLLDDVLPFPPKLADPFHDHWLAIVALATGEIAYVDEPLYDYVQHSGAVIGHSTANKKPRPIRRHLLDRLRNPGVGSRVVYYYHWYQQLLFAEVLRLRCWDRMSASKRRILSRLVRADTGVVGLSWLLARRIRRLWGHDETLDRELFYAYALVRRRAVSLWMTGRRRPRGPLPRDASIPPPPAGTARPREPS